MIYQKSSDCYGIYPIQKIVKKGEVQMLEKLKGLFVEEEGQGMAEYGLILGLIAVVCIGAVVALGDQIMAVFDKVVGGFEDNLPSDTTSGT